MRGTLVIVIVTSACCIAMSEPIVGGFSKVGEEDTTTINKCADKIMASLKEKEESANPGYTITTTMPEMTAEKQVVNGINYRCMYTIHHTYECESNANCLPKPAVDKQCTATVHAERDTTKPLTYVPGKEPKCN